jgi:hypothetical protein
MNIQQLIASKYPTLELPDYKKNDWKINGFDLKNKEYEFLHSGVKTGQFFLYEYMEYNSDRKGGEHTLLHYPRIAIYLNSRLVDMALEIDFFNVRRSWEGRREYDLTYKDKSYRQYPSELFTGIENVILWDDSVNVYGVWDKLPNWKELKRAYQKTIWFSKTIEDKRDQYLSNILK